MQLPSGFLPFLLEHAQALVFDNIIDGVVDEIPLLSDILQNRGLFVSVHFASLKLLDFVFDFNVVLQRLVVFLCAQNSNIFLMPFYIQLLLQELLSLHLVHMARLMQYGLLGVVHVGEHYFGDEVVVGNL